MRILSVGGTLLLDAMRKAGIEVAALSSPRGGSHPGDFDADLFRDPEGARSLLGRLVADFRPDWILQVDDSTPSAHLGLERFDIPKAWYAVDSHLHGWHPHYAALFDRVYCAQRNRLEAMAAYLPLEATVEWLPLCFTRTPAFLPWTGRDHDVSFVGSLNPALNPSRIALLEDLKSLGLPVHAVQGDFEPVYGRSKVVINQSVADDLNFRAFEAMGCGALLLTDALSHSLSELGEPGRDFLVYSPGDAADLARQARWALGHPVEAEAMARRGHERVVSRHMLSHRVGRLAADLAGGPPPGSLPWTHARQGDALAHLAAAQEHISRLDLPPDIVTAFARDARRMAGDALARSPASPWARLVLAQMELDAGRNAAALAFLPPAAEVPADPGYRRRYFFLSALLRALTGSLPEAKKALGEGLREFPGDGDLARLGEAIPA